MQGACIIYTSCLVINDGLHWFSSFKYIYSSPLTRVGALKDIKHANFAYPHTIWHNAQYRMELSILAILNDDMHLFFLNENRFKIV